MAVERRSRFLGSMRLDVPILRSIESATSADFDALIKAFATGQSQVLRGFELTNNINQAASGIQLIAANSAIFHGNSRLSGTFYTVPSNEPNQILNPAINTKVRGSFVPGAFNYVGIEFERIADVTTSDTAYFWEPTGKTEFSSSIPMAQVLKYTIVITTSVWAANVLPLARINVDISGNAVEITDQRPMLFRLGSAGFASPNPAYVYPWTDGRSENPSTSTSVAVNPFKGGDKQISSLKDWMDSIMSSLKEIKGTTFWYSPNIGGSIVKLRQDLGNLVITGRGNISHSDTNPGQLNWSEDLFISLVGSKLRFKILANPASSDITIPNNHSAYINLVRDQNIIPNLIFTNGSKIVSSVGGAAWTNNLLPGDYIKLVTEDATKYVQIDTIDSLSQITLIDDWIYSSTGLSGAKAQYAFATYEAVAVPTTDRHIKIVNKADVPFTEDIFWMFLREDNTGSVSRVYIRFLGSEIQEGEERDISDNQSSNILSFIGSTSESDTTPIYSNKITGNLETEDLEITVPAAASITSGEHFLINSAWDDEKYYVWFNKDGADGNPFVVGRKPLEVVISTGNSSTVVASALALVLNSVSSFNASSLSNIVSVALSQSGEAVDAQNIDVSGLSINILTQGVGYINKYIVDTENLTASIKRLDRALYELAGRADSIYEESYEVISPISALSDVVMLPNSKDDLENTPFIVGSGQLELFLNGQKLIVGNDYTEIGALDSESRTINTLQDLVVGDVLQFRIDPSKVAGSGTTGSGEANSGQNVGAGSQVFKSKVGTVLQFRTIVAGAGVSLAQSADEVTISSTPSAPTYNVQTVVASDYSATAANDYILVDCAGVDRTLTLPSAIGISGKLLIIKLISSGNNLEVETVLNQTMDGVNRTLTPLIINVQYESISLISDGANWWVS